MEHPAASQPATAREIILEIVRNMREGLEPLQYTTLPPSIYDVYLTREDLDRLRGIVPRILDEARRALDEELAALNRSSFAERLKITAASGPKVVPPDGGWQIRILENTDDGVQPGDIVIHSELALPARTEFGAGSMTKRIATRRLGGRESVSQNYGPAEPTPAMEAGARAFLQYEDQGGRKSYSMMKDEIVAGRGGQDYWTDLKLDTLPDVSREHFRLRRDPASGKFFLKDLSRLGTTINGERVPSSIEFVDGEKRDRNVETPVPEVARIGLAGVLFLEFRSAGNG
jgi:hypothetical protein